MAKRSALLVIGSALAMELASVAHAQQVPAVRVMARAEARRDTLTIVDGEGGVLASYAPPDARLSHVSVAPDEAHVAALEHVVVPQSVARPRVVVLTPQGSVVARSTRAARTYVWCCGGQHIAYVAGEPTESGGRPSGVYTLDVRTGAETAVPGLGSAYELHWGSFDNALYAKVPGPVRVVRYTQSDGRVTPTRHRDIDFSPQGRHYLHFPDDDDIVARLYDAARDVDVPLPAPSDLGLSGEWTPHRSRLQWFSTSQARKEELRIVGWAFDQGEILLFTLNRVIPSDTGSPPPGRLRRATREPIEHVLFDVRTRRIVGRIRGQLLPWAAPRGALPIQAAGRIHATTKAP